jgi:bla regulator protein BlaR1
MLTTLARASIDGAILVAIVWALTRVLRLSPSVRTIVWWSVAARFVVALVWPFPINIPILPAEPASAVPFAVRSASPLEIALGVPIPAGPSASTIVDSAIEWGSVAVIAWFAGIGLLAIVGGWRWRQTVRARRESSPASEPVQAMTAGLAWNLGLARVPEVRLSDRVNTPLVAGMLRPVVLLPTEGFDRLDPRQRQMAICHELAHVKRNDLWLGCIPALAERMFFFHPFAHVASREYALWREAACDAAVIEALDVAPQEYGRLLLDLGVARPRVGLAAAGASWSFLNLKRRIAMLHHMPTRSRLSRFAGAGAVVFSLAAIVPMQLVARGTRPIEGVPGEPSTGFVSRPETLELSAAVQAIERSREKPKEGKPDFDYVLLLEDNGSATMSGSSADVEKARRLKRPGEPMVWLRQNGREYVIRDPETLRLIQAVWNDVHFPMAEHSKELAHHSEALAKHAELAARHGLEAANQAIVGVKEGLVESRSQELSALKEVGRLAPRIDREELELATKILQENLREEMESLREQIQKLEEELREIKTPMVDFKVPESYFKHPFEDMSKELEMHAKAMADGAHKAEAEMRELIQRALSKGLGEVIR